MCFNCFQFISCLIQLLLRHPRKLAAKWFSMLLHVHCCYTAVYVNPECSGRHSVFQKWASYDLKPPWNPLAYNQGRRLFAYGFYSRIYYMVLYYHLDSKHDKLSVSDNLSIPRSWLTIHLHYVVPVCFLILLLFLRLSFTSWRLNLSCYFILSLKSPFISSFIFVRTESTAGSQLFISICNRSEPPQVDSPIQLHIAWFGSVYTSVLITPDRMTPH